MQLNSLKSENDYLPQYYDTLFNLTPMCQVWSASNK